MDNTTHHTKRKKRRTRKCLNEIRNRSRCTINGNLSEQSSLQLTKICKTNNNLVTMDRLTLKTIFPKAITSDTITRLAITDIKQKQNINFREFLKDNIKSTNIDTIVDMNHETLSNTRNIEILQEDEENSISIEHDKSHDCDARSSSSVLFSPVQKSFKINNLPKEDHVTTTLTSSPNLFEDNRQHLYQDFINDIPAYLSQLTSSITNDDVIKSTIHKLQKLFAESHHELYEDNIPSNNVFCQNESIVENPLDYIRLEHARQQSALGPQHLSASSGTSGSSPSSVNSPANLCSPADPCSPTTPHVSPAPSHTFNVVLYDTPDFNYYPHCLN